MIFSMRKREIKIRTGNKGNKNLFTITIVRSIEPFSWKSALMLRILYAVCRLCAHVLLTQVSHLHRKKKEIVITIVQSIDCMISNLHFTQDLQEQHTPESKVLACKRLLLGSVLQKFVQSSSKLPRSRRIFDGMDISPKPGHKSLA